MSETLDKNNSNDPSYSSLAALSAHHSLKRARVLYATNPQAAFIPSVDPIIHQASLNRRRRRRRRPQVPAAASAAGNNTALLALVNDNENHTTLTMQPLVGEESAGNTALTLHGDSSKSDKPKPGGILVVSAPVQNPCCRLAIVIFLYLSFLSLLIFSLEIRQGWRLQTQNSDTGLARALEVIHGPVVASGMGPELGL
jgi:hypothetical protein